MNSRGSRKATTLAVAAVAMATGATAYAQDASVEALERRVGQLEEDLKATRTETTPEERATTQWRVSGYADVGYTSSDNDSDGFDAGHFAPVFTFQYDDWVLFESELKFTPGGGGEGDVEVEYSVINFLLHDSVTLAVGKFLSPIGQFQERLHPSWVNKLPNAPAGFGHGGLQPLSDVGLQVRGGVPLGSQKFTYAVYAGNGPAGVGHHGLELEGFSPDNNSNKAVGGRLGYFIMPQLEIGVSALQAGVGGDNIVGDQPEYELMGVDAAFTRGPWDVRLEYLDSELEAFDEVGHSGAVETVDATEWEAGYVQVAYQFGRWEPVVRAGTVDVEGGVHGDAENEDRVNVGLNYLFGPSLVGKAAVESRDFDEGGSEDNDRVFFQVSYGF